MLIGSLLNLTALVETAKEMAAGGDIAVICAGYKGAFAFDDAYCAGKIVEALGGVRSDAAIAAIDICIRPAPSTLHLY